MREKIVAGNWKMNLTSDEAVKLSEEIKSQASIKQLGDVKLILIPSFVYLESIKRIISDCNICVGSQDVSNQINGAYTGDISSSMLKSIGIEYCLLGHSERRQYHQENNQILSEKLNRLIEDEITPIFCIGETLEQRENGQ